MPPLQPRQRHAGAGADRALVRAAGPMPDRGRAAAQRVAHVVELATCIRRASDRKRVVALRDHRDDRRPRRRSPGSSSASSSQAASYTRPTCIVEVRKTGVSASPHSCIDRKPVHSPGAVEHRAAGRDRAAEQVAAGVEHRHAGARDAAAVRRVGLVAPHRGVPDADPGHVEHRVRSGRTGSSPILTGRSAARGTVHSMHQHARRAPADRWSGPTTCCATSRGAEVWVGVRTPGTEVPERATVLREAVTAAGATVVAGARRTTTRCCARCTTRRWSTTCGPSPSDWAAGDRTRSSSARTASCPTSSRPPGMLDGLPAHEPTATHARAGRLVLRHDDAGRPGHLGGGPGGRRRRPDRRRPGGRRAPRRRTPWSARPGTTRPGARSAAPATSTTPPSRPSALRDRGADRVAVVDVDAHHGNGTAGDLLRPRRRVLRARCTSTRAPAGSRTSSGFADETRPRRRRRRDRQRAARARAPATRAGWPPLDELLDARRGAFGADALVVSLGVDAAGADPESPLEVTHRRASAARASGSRRWACRPCSCTRAATSSPGWAWTRSPC